MIAGLHHIGIASTDRERLASFYCDLFGFAVQYCGRWERGDARIDAMVGLPGSSADYLVLGADGMRLEIFEYHSPAGLAGDPDRPVCDSGITHLCLQVTDLDAEYARLREAGMRFHCPPSSRESRQHRAIYGRDPDGNVIELIEIIAADHPFGTRIEEPAA